MKKKISQLKDKLKKEQDTLKRMKENYEKLLYCKGSDGERLIELWGLNTNEHFFNENLINSPDTQSLILDSIPTGGSISAINSNMGSPE